MLVTLLPSVVETQLLNVAHCTLRGIVPSATAGRNRNRATHFTENMFVRSEASIRLTAHRIAR
jgi:hypothetical protein